MPNYLIGTGPIQLLAQTGTGRSHIGILCVAMLVHTVILPREGEEGERRKRRNKRKKMEEEKGDEVEAVEEAGKMYRTMQQAVGAWVATGDGHASIGGGKEMLVRSHDSKCLRWACECW